MGKVFTEQQRFGEAEEHWRRAAELGAETGEDLALGQDGEGTAIAHWRDTAFKADEGALAFETLLCHARAYSGYARMTGTPWFAAYARRSQFAELFRSKRQSSTDTTQFLDQLYAAPPDEWPVRLRRIVSDAVSLILRRSIDPDHPLAEMPVAQLRLCSLLLVQDSPTMSQVADELRISVSAVTPNNGIPLVGSVAAGAPILAEENIEEYLEVLDVIGGEDGDYIPGSFGGTNVAELGLGTIAAYGPGDPHRSAVDPEMSCSSPSPSCRPDRNRAKAGARKSRDALWHSE